MTINKTLDIALQMFHDDQLVGGDYPPSFWDATTSNPPTPPGGNPYEAPGQDSTGRGGSIRVYGAQMLVWGLAGADYLGTPGYSKKLNELYALNNGIPVNERRGPYVDLTKLNAKNPTLRNTTSSLKASPSIPVIMDDFGNAILYYRADTRQQGMDRYLRPTNDNEPFYSAWSGDRSHDDWIGDPASPSGKNFGPGPEPFRFSGFGGFIHNPKVAATPQAHNPDSYLMISPGPDALYGTRDDVANFPVDAANIPTGW